MTDIEKAFLQIRIRKEDRAALRFLWFDEIPTHGDPKPQLLTWRITRVPFGTTSSTFLLSATLRHHLDNQMEAYPETANLIKEAFYVDDILTN